MGLTFCPMAVRVGSLPPKIHERSWFAPGWSGSVEELLCGIEGSLNAAERMGGATYAFGAVSYGDGSTRECDSPLGLWTCLVSKGTTVVSGFEVAAGGTDEAALDSTLTIGGRP